ncbi:tellurite resistance TerB family protein [Photobacterium profundum]|uniref:Inner membrane protein n=1 Tax=Photobacterium profundum (strain SS9) TaxID=298386 RepID=Q6LUU4_PHOPR|nr:tellurite resistance TerB family protein [Photobacterium profundum]CAG18931.1 hypothetical protein PBPRA0501 [Photobacterium profundum SS9]
MKSLFDQLINQASSYMEKSSSSSSSSSSSKADLVKGVATGGLVGALVGNKKSRKLVGKYGKNVAVIGGTAAIGTVAYQAYKKWFQDQTETTTASVDPILTELAPLKTDQEILMKAMIFAAKADGHIDIDEKAAITQWLQQNGITHDVEALIARWLDEPLNPHVIANAVDGLEQASEVYLISLLVIDVDHFLERAYLDALAEALALPPVLIERIEEQVTLS